MGRWAQRRVAGGGPQPSPALVEIIDAVMSGTEDALVSYTGPVDATDFGATDFQTLPDANEPGTVFQFSPTQLLLGWGFDQTSQISLQYIGSVAGVLTPQIVALS